MISRLGLRALRRPGFSLSRTLTTQTTITDHTNGKVITLSDPARPEIGDYPNPKPVLAQSKDPYAVYDDPQNRRNLNDSLHIDDDLYDMWSPDYYDFVSNKTALKHNAIFFSVIIGLGTAVWYFEFNPAKPAMPRSFPYGGLAKELGSGSEKDEYFYRVKPDTNAEQELGFLPEEDIISKNKASYEAANSDFIQV